MCVKWILSVLFDLKEGVSLAYCVVELRSISPRDFSL